MHCRCVCTKKDTLSAAPAASSAVDRMFQDCATLQDCRQLSEDERCRLALGMARCFIKHSSLGTPFPACPAKVSPCPVDS